MKERPILFSGPMVKAIIDGRKTQTRRVVKRVDHGNERINHAYNPRVSTGPYTSIESSMWHFCHRRPMPDGSPSSHCAAIQFATCPYGLPGDRLWVREAFSLVPCSAGCEKYPDGFDPKIASIHQPTAPHEGVRYKATWDRCHSAPWRPSIHMPRWASRITLEVTAVRVERLQAISEADAMMEGVDAIPMSDMPRNGCFTRRDDFRQLWDIINGKSCPWESNPWVWAMTFRKAVSDGQ